MEASILWKLACRGLVTAALLMLVTPHPMATAPDAHAAEHFDLAAEMMRQLPVGMSIDQVLAMMLR